MTNLKPDLHLNRTGRRRSGLRGGWFCRRHVGLRMAVLALVPAGMWAAGAALGPTAGVTSSDGLPDLPDPLSLPVAIEIALAANPALASADARVEAAAGRAWQAGRWSNPALTLAVEEWPLDNGGHFRDGKQTIGIQQQLPWPGKPGLERRLGAVGVEWGKALRRLRQIELVRDVKAAFARVLAAREAVGLGDELVALAASSAETAGKRVRAGAAPYQEQLRTEVQLAQVRAEADGLRRDLANARQVLAALLGRTELAEVGLTGELPRTGEARLIGEPPADWPADHPSLQAATLALDRAELSYSRARLEPYPDITASVAGGRLGELDSSIVEFSLAIPLPLLDSSRGRKDEAAANITAAEAELREVRLRLEREWRVARQRYRTAAEQAATYRDEILPKSDEALRLVQAGFDEGKFSLIDLLDTQRTTAQTRFAFQQVRLELGIARAELEALLETSHDVNDAQTSRDLSLSTQLVP